MTNIKNQFFGLLFAFVFLFAANSNIYAKSKSIDIPPKEADAKEQLNKSPRHGEWVTYTAGNEDKVDAWIVYPEIKEKAPVVIVIHEIFGLTDWIRSVADQLAKEGFIAIAPDFLSGKAPGGKGSAGLDSDTARALIRALDQGEIIRRLNGAVEYATNLPAASKKFSVMGFCWGGGNSFNYATVRPDLTAAIVYYGTSPSTESLKNVNASILGLYGGEDNRVNATIPAAEEELKKLKKTFEKEIYAGAGHGFLRQQDGQNGANLTAAKAAWKRTIDFLKKTFKDNKKKISMNINTVSELSDINTDCCDEH